MSTVPVLIALRSPREAAVSAAIESHPALTVRQRCAELADAVSAAQAGVGAVVVIGEQAQLTREVVADLQRRTVVIALADSPEGAARLRILGLSTIVSHDDPAAIAADVATAATSLPGVQSMGDASETADERSALAASAGRIVAVWGPTGAPGRTTVAVNLAASLAHDGARTLVVDADTYGGAVAQACGMLDESAGIVGVARLALRGAVSDADLVAHTREIAPRLSVLSGISRAHRWPELPGAALDVVWEAAGRCFDAVVIDVGFSLEQDEELTYDTHAPQRNAATLSAIEAADVVVAVGTAEPLGVQRLIQGLEGLRALAPSPVVVVNRVRHDVAGPKPAQTLADALTRYAGVDNAWMLPWDPKAADGATLAGQVLRERAPRAKLTRAIEMLARGIGAHGEGAESARPSTVPASALTH